MASSPTKPQPPPVGTTKSKVHDVFKNRIDGWKQKGKAAGEATKQEEIRGWDVPEDLEASNLLAVASLHAKSFDRTEVNTNYLECFQDAQDMGTVADVIALKLQVDYVAAEERAFRARHASTVRCLIHAAARKRKHEKGPMFAAVEAQIGDIISAGSNA